MAGRGEGGEKSMDLGTRFSALMSSQESTATAAAASTSAIGRRAGSAQEASGAFYDHDFGEESITGPGTADLEHARYLERQMELLAQEQHQASAGSVSLPPQPTREVPSREGGIATTNQMPQNVPTPHDELVQSLAKSVGRYVYVSAKGKRSKHKGQRGSSANSQEDQAAVLNNPGVAVNCLYCGKIYDCRTWSDEVAYFLQQQQICTFCGNPVRQGDELSVGLEPAEGNPGDAEGDQSSRRNKALDAALSFKDRLVDFDKNSAKRTTVLDDQADYFDIESNVWLNEDEKRELKRREAEALEAEEKRRRQLIVSIDLVGRRVVMTKEGEASEEMQIETEETATSERIPEAHKMYMKENLALGLAHSETANMIKPVHTPQNAHVLTQPTTVRPAENLIARPIFRSQETQGLGKKKDAPDKTQRNMRSESFSRVQHDELTVSDIIQQEAEALQNRKPTDPDSKADVAAYDIGMDPCTADFMMRLRLTSLSALGPVPLRRRESRVLGPGFVYLQNWINLELQAHIIRLCRQLSREGAGFVRPEFETGARMHLRMMCLGATRWNAQKSKYEESFLPDGSKANPMLPKELSSVAESLVDDANREILNHDQNSLELFPGCKPDVCLVNFYEPAGSLGMHQDKDEDPSIIRKGVPVISISIGDSADFRYSHHSKDDTHNSVKLQSGDVILFGGHSRLVYHGVSKIHRGTAPKPLREILRPGRLNLTFRQVSHPKSSL